MHLQGALNFVYNHGNFTDLGELVLRAERFDIIERPFEPALGNASGGIISL